MSATALSAPGVALDAGRLIGLRRVALQASADPVLAAMPGGFATRRKGHGQEVADVREYVAGDDFRHLDRGSTARTGKLHVRQFQEERDRVNLLVADFRPSMFWGVSRVFRSVAAAEALALIGWRTAEEGGRVGLLAITPGDPVIVPARGRTRGMLDVIGGLVRAHADGLAAVAAGQDANLPLEQALSRVDRLSPAGAEIVIASGFDAAGDGLADRLTRLERRRVTRLLLIEDADRHRLPGGRYPIRLPDGRRARVVLDDSAPQPMPMQAQIVSRPALRIDAADPPDVTARRIMAAGQGA